MPRAITNLTGWPNSANYSPAYRQFYLNDRDHAQAKFQMDVDVFRNLAVLPTLIWLE